MTEFRRVKGFVPMRIPEPSHVPHRRLQSCVDRWTPGLRVSTRANRTG
jgi:hypothetical protein